MANTTANPATTNRRNARVRMPRQNSPQPASQPQPQTVRIQVEHVPPPAAPAPQPAPLPPPIPAARPAATPPSGTAQVIVALALAIIAVLFFGLLFFGPSKQQDVGTARPPVVTSTTTPPAATPGEARLPAGVYRDQSGQLRVQRAAPDNSPSGEWRESRISCRGRTKGEQFRCETGGVNGWCTC